MQVSFGDMIACDNENVSHWLTSLVIEDAYFHHHLIISISGYIFQCEGGEWFHYQCVGLSSETRFKGKWYCPSCKILQRRGLLDPPT